jgi:GNAT superfamily N-acetyltransferase
VIELRVASTDAEYETWAAIKTAVVPNEPITAAQLRRDDAEPGRLLLLASSDGADVGSGIAALSNFGGRAFIAVRVLPEHRGRGIGTMLVRALADHARALGRDGVNAFVDPSEPHSVAFAERFGLREVDYQLETVRDIGPAEGAPEPPPGVRLEPVGAERREEILEKVWPHALEAYAELPLPGQVTYPVETWLREEATVPDGSFVARSDGEVLGYAGLMDRAVPGTAEHGFTFVSSAHRHRGIGRALKRAQIHWASQNGLRLLISWTQKGNEGMQALNRSLDYREVSRVLTMQGPLP